MGRTRLALAAAAAVGLSAVVAACGGSSGGPLPLKYYPGLDPGGTNVKAAKECSQQSGGKYNIEIVPLANSADASRELLVRRLAAHDGDIDMVQMDTIWTSEFAAAGWLREMKGADKTDALDDVLAGPAQSVLYKNKVYGIPLNTNAQLLWYRKDLVPNPPKTWDEMVAMAKKLPAKEGLIEEQGNHYEGYVVWFNNLVNSAGGTIVNTQGRPTLGAPAVKAAQIITTSSPPGARTRRCPPSRRIRTGSRSRPARRRSSSTGRTCTPPPARTRRPVRSRRRSSRTWATPAGRASIRTSRARCRSAGPTSACRSTGATRSTRRRPRCA